MQARPEAQKRSINTGIRIMILVGVGSDLASNRREMGNELITEHDERIRSYFQALGRLSKTLETLFSKRKFSLDGESFYTDEELSQRLKISRRSLQDYRNQERIPYIKLGGKILYRSSDVERMLKKGYRNEFRQTREERGCKTEQTEGRKRTRATELLQGVTVHSFSPLHR